MRTDVRRAGAKRHRRELPRVRLASGGTKALLARAPGHGRKARRFQRVGTAGRRWLLRWRLPRSHPLSRIPELAARLAARSPTEATEPDRPKAAVAVILAPDPDSVLLIRRAEREDDRWSGQLAFPGGRWSAGDAYLVATARRETREEVAVDLADAPVIGVLDDLAPRTPHLPPILVRPFVFTLPASVPLRPNAEVSGAWWMPFDTFLAPGTYRAMEYQRYGTILQGTGYYLEPGVLWGMTERILTPLLELLKQAPPP